MRPYPYLQRRDMITKHQFTRHLSQSQPAREQCAPPPCALLRAAVLCCVFRLDLLLGVAGWHAVCAVHTAYQSPYQPCW